MRDPGGATVAERISRMRGAKMGPRRWVAARTAASHLKWRTSGIGWPEAPHLLVLPDSHQAGLRERPLAQRELDAGGVRVRCLLLGEPLAHFVLVLVRLEFIEPDQLRADTLHAVDDGNHLPIGAAGELDVIQLL